MKKINLNACIIAGLILACGSAYAQDKLYTNEFPLKDVTLLESPFRHARNLNIKVLLKYDVDRLLAGYRTEAGQRQKYGTGKISCISRQFGRSGVLHPSGNEVRKSIWNAPQGERLGIYESLFITIQPFFGERSGN